MANEQKVDPETLDVIKNMWVDITPNDWPTKVTEDVQQKYTPEEIQKFIDEELKTKEAEEPKIEEPKPAEPVAVNPEEQSFADILKELEATSKESSDAGDQVTDTTQKLDEKVQQLEKWDTTSETVKEIVQLNAKLQADQAVSNAIIEQNAKKIKELSDKINYYELDDTRLQVPEDIKIPVKHYISFIESKNDSFRIKALEGFIQFVSRLGWWPIDDYLSDVIKTELKKASWWITWEEAVPANIEKKTPPQTELDKFVAAHWIPKGL